MPCCAARPTRASSIPTRLLVGSEFNGASPFLKELNAGPDDLIPGVEMMAIRSDTNDKYSQPDGRFIGAPGKPTGVGYDASELRGARNVILDGLDHREVAFNKLAFGAMYEFITGKPPANLFIAQEPLPVLNGKVTGIADGGIYTNLAGRRRRGRDLRGRRQDRRAQEHRAGASQDDRRGRRVGPLHRQVPTPTTSSCCAWRRSPSPTPIARRSCARATWCICGPRVFAKGDETAARDRHHEPAARLFRRRPRQVQPRRQGAARHQRRRARRLDRQARLRRPARAPCWRCSTTRPSRPAPGR